MDLERDPYGNPVPAWTAGDDEGPERLVVELRYVPVVLVNGSPITAEELRDAHPEAFSEFELSSVVPARALRALSPADVLEFVAAELDEVRSCALDGLIVFADRMHGAVAVVLREALRRRGFDA